MVNNIWRDAILPHKTFLLPYFFFLYLIIIALLLKQSYECRYMMSLASKFRGIRPKKLNRLSIGFINMSVDRSS